LRILTDVLGQTTFITLEAHVAVSHIWRNIHTDSRYQAGESIYELFDTVLVLDQGRQVYFGPPSETRAYFENLGYNTLPRQSTADYLTGCTDPNERQFAPGRSADDTPSSPQGLENAFLMSPLAHDMQDSMEKYKIHMETDKADQQEFRAAVLSDKKKGVSKKSPYTLGFRGQVRALTIRQFQTRIQDKFQLYTSFGLSTVRNHYFSCGSC
jgi:ATP-binding cassette, subfamily G (WHITE), member 2, SNQ2